MARLIRPYIPLDVRIRVIERQLMKKGAYNYWDRNIIESRFPKMRERLFAMLSIMFEGEVHLDHDPALENRVKVFDNNGRLVGYQPDANDPEYLVYRNKHDHHIKTNVRGDGAQYPDRVLANRERKRNRKKVKRKWPSRPFQKKKKLTLSARLAALNLLNRH
jgi:hypothetical protein